jgi:FkbM family methyltransferase
MTSKQRLVPRAATPVDRALRGARDRVRVLERLSRWEPVGRLVSVLLLGRLVVESPRFILNELAGRRSLRRYTLRNSRLRVWLRHNAPDVQNFDEIFYQGLYAVPEPVARLLRRRRDIVVADLGANIGLAGAYFLGQLPGARAVAFEPDPQNLHVHRRTIASNDTVRGWKLVEACAWTDDGDVPFVTGAFAESHVADDDAPSHARLPAVDVFPYLANADVVKIDVEGSEWRLLADPRFADLETCAVVLEYHALLCPEPDPKAAAARLLEGAGYEVDSIFHDADGTGMLWAWRPSKP